MIAGIATSMYDICFPPLSATLDPSSLQRDVGVPGALCYFGARILAAQ
jgi:hypothetical protein